MTGESRDHILVAGEIDGVGPTLGTTSLRSYFEELRDLDLHEEGSGWEARVENGH